MESGTLVIMHKTGGIVRRLSPGTDRKIRDLVRAESGPEIVLERRRGAFTHDIDIKDEKTSKAPEAELKKPRNPAKPGANSWTFRKSDRVALGRR